MGLDFNHQYLYGWSAGWNGYSHESSPLGALTSGSLCDIFFDMRIQEQRREAFPHGSRVRAVRFAEDGGPSETLPRGTEGTVEHVDDMGTVHVHWDNGSRLGALLEDTIVRI